MPGDVFTERNHIADGWSWGNRLTLSQKAVEPPPQASSTFQFWTDLAHRMGFAEYFPWNSIEDISRSQTVSFWSAALPILLPPRSMESPPPKFRKYRSRGFATPSGKVELYSSVLEDMGFDPLPYYREGPTPNAEYPYAVFTGVREDPFFQTGQRNIEVLRARCPTPKLFLHPTDAQREALQEDDWVILESATGKVAAQVSIQSSMKEGHIRVPHGWWYPESRGQQSLAGAFISSDAVLCSDEDCPS